MREKILTHLRSHHYRPLRLRRLAHFFDVAEEDYAEFRSLVKNLIREGEVAIGARGKLVPAERPAPPKRPAPTERPAPTKRPRERTVQGRFSLSARGFGFVEPDSPEGPTRGEDVYVGPGDTAGAVTNDTVLAQVTRKTPRGYAGKVVEILQRGQTRFVGTYLVADGRPIVRPDGGILLQDFPVPDASSAGARPKDKVVFEVLKYALSGEPGEAVIVEVLGRRGDPGVDTLTVIRQFDLADEFSEGALAEARRAAERIDEEALRSRRDLTGQTVITIDPEDARDYDDAISLLENRDGTVTLGVHIADVSHFVQEGSPLDAEARERGTSVYLPTTVIPMLPETLSNGACSLQEGRTRLTKSAFITFNREAEPVRAEFANSFIRSAKRLTYQQAQAALEGKADGLAPEVVDLLRAMDRLARSLLERRRRDGYLELDLPQVDLEFDDEGRVIAAHPEDASFTHRIIEMFMVEANEAVARELAHRGIPFIRRIHPDPDAEAAEELKHFARSVGQELRDPSDRKELQGLLNRVRGRPEAYGIHLAVLKSLRRAEYSTKPEGHFALASDAYCHFTSPIRRYPDLAVHRALDRALRGEAKQKGGGRQEGKESGDAGADLAALAVHSSQTERRAEAAERELTKIKLLEFLEAKVGEVYSGVITGVQAFGLFVEIPNLLIDGLVHISSLKDDQYAFDRKRWALVGRRKGRILRVGSCLEIRIVRVDIPRRQLDLEPVEAAEEARAPSGPAREPKKKRRAGRGRR
ncbi:MAG: ribonuclease R [Planctomycetota bacterium]|nr:ribonuclease R [Planctomycetota bacterium]